MYEPTDPPPEALTLIQALLGADDAERIERAYRFAEAAHQGQVRDEGTPFIEHPARVAVLLWEELGVRDVDLLIAALNHDSIEDNEVIDRSLVASAFGERVAQLVSDVTKKPAGPAGREARDREYLDHLREIPKESRLLKLADRIDNLRSIPKSNDEAKKRRYLLVSRAEFLPLAAATDPVAHGLLAEACDAIERSLARLDE